MAGVKLSPVQARREWCCLCLDSQAALQAVLAVLPRGPVLVPTLMAFPCSCLRAGLGDTTQGHVGAAMEHSAQELLNTIIFLMIAHKLPGLGCPPPAKGHAASLRATLPSISHQQSHSHPKAASWQQREQGFSLPATSFSILPCPRHGRAQPFLLLRVVSPPSLGMFP